MCHPPSERTNHRLKISNIKKETLTAKKKARAITRSQTKERLARNLESLESYCKPGAADNAHDWPSYELLGGIRHDVLCLARLERKRQIWPVWKAFEQVDKRMEELHLKSRVNAVIARARNMLRSESELSKAIRGSMKGDAMAQCSLRDLVLQPEKFARLLSDDREMVTKWCLAYPLMRWAIEIRHPVVEDLPKVKKFLPTVEKVKALHHLYKTSERVREWRKAKENSSN